MNVSLTAPRSPPSGITPQPLHYVQPPAPVGGPVNVRRFLVTYLIAADVSGCQEYINKTTTKFFDGMKRIIERHHDTQGALLTPDILEGDVVQLISEIFPLPRWYRPQNGIDAADFNWDLASQAYDAYLLDVESEANPLTERSLATGYL